MAEQDKEYIAARIFDGIDHARKIECRGELIRISDPKVKGVEPYWVYESTTTNAEHDVPPGFEIEVINGWVKLTKSAAG